MATFNLGSINYPDNLQAELLAAMRRHYGQKHFDAEGAPLDEPVDYTAAEIRQMFRRGVRDSLQAIFEKHIDAKHDETRPTGDLQAVED